jgi:AraC family transcriptional regulator
MTERSERHWFKPNGEGRRGKLLPAPQAETHPPRCTYLTREAARQDVFEYIEILHNLMGKQRNNGILSPVDFEATQQKLNEAGVYQTKGTSMLGGACAVTGWDNGRFYDRDFVSTCIASQELIPALPSRSHSERESPDLVVKLAEPSAEMPQDLPALSAKAASLSGAARGRPCAAKPSYARPIPIDRFSERTCDFSGGHPASGWEYSRLKVITMYVPRRDAIVLSACPAIAPACGTLEPSVGDYLVATKAMLAHDPDGAQDLLDRLGALLASPGGVSSTVEGFVEPVTSVRAGAGGLTKWQLRKTLAFIQTHLSETIRVDTLASLVNLSSGYFSRAFRASTGNSPHNYIIRLRVRNAQILMLTTQEPLSDIAQICGFTDQAHMTHYFGRHVNYTPYIWRRTFKAA